MLRLCFFAAFSCLILSILVDSHRQRRNALINRVYRGPDNDIRVELVKRSLPQSFIDHLQRSRRENPPSAAPAAAGTQPDIAVPKNKESANARGSDPVLRGKVADILQLALDRKDVSNDEDQALLRSAVNKLRGTDPSQLPKEDVKNGRDGQATPDAAAPTPAAAPAARRSRSRRAQRSQRRHRRQFPADDGRIDKRFSSKRRAKRQRRRSEHKRNTKRIKRSNPRELIPIRIRPSRRVRRFKRADPTPTAADAGGSASSAAPAQQPNAPENTLKIKRDHHHDGHHLQARNRGGAMASVAGTSSVKRDNAIMDNTLDKRRYDRLDKHSNNLLRGKASAQRNKLRQNPNNRKYVEPVVASPAYRAAYRKPQQYPLKNSSPAKRFDGHHYYPAYLPGWHHKPGAVSGNQNPGFGAMNKRHLFEIHHRPAGSPQANINYANYLSNYFPTQSKIKRDILLHDDIGIVHHKKQRFDHHNPVNFGVLPAVPGPDAYNAYPDAMNKRDPFHHLAGSPQAHINYPKDLSSYFPTQSKIKRDEIFHDDQGVVQRFDDHHNPVNFGVLPAVPDQGAYKEARFDHHFDHGHHWSPNMQQQPLSAFGQQQKQLNVGTAEQGRGVMRDDRGADKEARSHGHHPIHHSQLRNANQLVLRDELQNNLNKDRRSHGHHGHHEERPSPSLVAAGKRTGFIRRVARPNKMVRSPSEGYYRGNLRRRLASPPALAYSSSSSLGNSRSPVVVAPAAPAANVPVVPAAFADYQKRNEAGTKIREKRSHRKRHNRRHGHHHQNRKRHTSGGVKRSHDW